MTPEFVIDAHHRLIHIEKSLRMSAAGLGRVLTGCAALLRPGGRLAVLFSRDPAHRSWLSGEPEHVLPAGLRAGLDVVDYLFADERGRLLTRYAGDRLTTPPMAIDARVLMLRGPAAHDVIVFGKPAPGEVPR